jgi:MFS transporter, DHA1 family, multidrug resistance protein
MDSNDNISRTPFFKLKRVIELIKSRDESWQKNLLFISIAQFIAMIGMSSCVPFLPLYIRQLGINNIEEAQLWSGLIFSGPYWLSIITVPLWGVLADKYGHKLMVIRAIFGLSIAMTLMGFANDVVQLLILRIFQGAVSGFIAAALGFITVNTPENRSGYAIGILQSSISAGNIFGPFIGGILSDIIGIRPVFFIVGAFCLLSCIFIITYVKESKVKVKLINNTIIQNFKFIRKNKHLRIALIIIILSQAGIFFTFPIFPYFVESLQAPHEILSTITGLLIGIVAIFNILFAPFWGRKNDSGKERKNLILGTIVTGLVIMFHIAMNKYYYLFPLRAIQGIFIAAIIPTLYTILNKKVPAENKGGIMGFASSATLFGSLISFLFCGITASNFGMMSCFIISGLLLFAAATIAVFKL